MAYISSEDALNWKRRVRRPFYIFNTVAMIPVAAMLTGFALDGLSRAGYVDLGDGLIGFVLAAPVILLGLVTLVSIPVNLVVAVAVRNRDTTVSVHAMLVFCLVIGVLFAMNAQYILDSLR